MEEKRRENSGVENGEANSEGVNKEFGKEHLGLQENGMDEEEEAVKAQQLIMGVGQKKVKAKEEKEASAITADNRDT